MDVVGLDIDKLVCLEHHLVELIDPDQIADRFGLDKTIMVTLYNFELPNKSPQETRALITKYLYKKLAELVDYDPRNLKLQYKLSSTSLF